MPVAQYRLHPLALIASRAAPRAALVAGALLAAASSIATAAPPAPKLELDKSVLLLRHGLRSPNQSAAELAKSSTRPWPEWSVPPGDLTANGAALIGILGGYYRQQYAAAGLLPAEGCPEPGSVASWADNAAKRIPLSAQALLDGLAPGCGLKAGYDNSGALDPLFHASELGLCPVSGPKGRGAVLKAAGGSLEHAVQKVVPELKQLQAIVQVRSLAACADDVPSCGLEGQANALAEGPEGPKLEGGLKRATTLGENFLLEYMEGLPEADIAWGEATTPEALAPLLAPRNLYLRLTRSAPYLAARDSTRLAQALLDALDDRADAASASASKLLAFVGRDIHLANFAGLLGVQWTLPGQPDNNAPDVTLAFERLRDPASGAHYVRTLVYYQTLTQMRGREALDLAHPPGKVVLKIPGCDKGAVDGACPLPVFREHLRKALAPDCLPGATPAKS